MKTRLSSLRPQTHSLRALLCVVVASTPSTRAADFIWKGGAGANNWTLNGSWTTSAPANDGSAALTFTDSFFTGTNFVFPNLNANYSIASLAFNGTHSFNLFTDAGATLTIGSGE